MYVYPKKYMNKLFESNAHKVKLPSKPDAQIIFHSAPYIQHEQIKLNDDFRKYLQSTVISKHVLRTGIRQTPYH